MNKTQFKKRIALSLAIIIDFAAILKTYKSIDLAKDFFKSDDAWANYGEDFGTPEYNAIVEEVYTHFSKRTA